MATNTQAIVDQWDDVRERLRERWTELTDDDLEMVRENLDAVIHRIEERTGEARHDVQQFMSAVVDKGRSVATRARERASHMAESAAEAARRRADRAGELATEGYRAAKTTVRRHPLESVLTIFGLGCIAGFLIAWIVKNDR